MEIDSNLLTHALQHHRAGRLELAEAGYRDCLRAAPRDANALHLLGVVCHQQQRHACAVELINEAIDLRSEFAPFHCNLGVAYRALGQLDEAVECYREAIRLNPNWSDPHYNLGNACKDLGRLDEAIESYRTAISLDPNNADAYNNLGDALKLDGQYQQAVESHRRAISLRPNFAEAWFNLGNALKRAGALDDALAAYRRAVELRPGYVDAHVNLGFVYEEQGRFGDAIASYGLAIELAPESADAHFNRALAWLRLGDFAQGWNEYEWRPSLRSAHSDTRLPIWNGQDARDKSLLVRGEQGIGDEIMFASCLPDLVRQRRTCTLECDARLVKLFQRSFSTVRVKARSTQEHSDGVEIALGSLPKYFRPSLDSFPVCSSYLLPDAQAVRKWRSRYASIGNGSNVGISWRGGKDELVRVARSTTLEQWDEVLSTPGFQFVNLQYGASADEVCRAMNDFGATIHHWSDSDPLTNLDDFAAQIAALDLVISVDNSTVHMAGALGIPTWVLLPFASDWRWLTGRSDSPWYSSVRLFRQPRLGDWPSVFSNISAQLRHCQPISHSAACTISSCTSNC